MNRKILCLLLSLVIFTGCSADEMPSNAESEFTSSTNATTTTATSASTTIQTTTAATTTTTVSQTTVQTTTVSEEPDNDLDPDELIPTAIQTPRVDGNRLLFTIMNVYSDGEYYTVDISGVKMDGNREADLETTYVKGDLYGDFRLDLIKNNEVIDTLKINVPRDDRFLILESVIDNLSYGVELISNKREYSADEYPDLIQMDFHIIKEPETPQYARFFAIFDEKIIELPVFDNGVETAPYGTHLEMESAGLMTQHIVASQANGIYTVIKYEYTVDVQDRCLNRKQVKFYG